MLCAQIPGNDLVAAECEQLTGGTPDALGMAVCQRLDGVPNSAYLSAGIRCLAEAATPEALAVQISQVWHNPDVIVPESFRVEVVRLGSGPHPGKTKCILAAANAIPARPNLSEPHKRYAVVSQPGKLWFGEFINEGTHSYRLHDSKPYRTSSSLPSRLARAVVNLVSPPAQSILDPFCGIGSILLEAAALGLAAYGLDHNRKMVGMTRRNLAHFGYTAQADPGEAGRADRAVDAIVTDLPYGRLLEQDAAGLLPILKHLCGLAPQAIYIAEEKITPLLSEAGYGEIRVMGVRKRHGMGRFVHLAKTD